MGVVSECCCKEVYYRYPHNNYYFSPTPLVLAFLGAASSLFLCSFLKCFFVLVINRRMYIIIVRAHGRELCGHTVT